MSLLKVFSFAATFTVLASSTFADVITVYDTDYSDNVKYSDVDNSYTLADDFYLYTYYMGFNPFEEGYANLSEGYLEYSVESDNGSAFSELTFKVQVYGLVQMSTDISSWDLEVSTGFGSDNWYQSDLTTVSAIGSEAFIWESQTTRLVKTNQQNAFVFSGWVAESAPAFPHPANSSFIADFNMKIWLSASHAVPEPAVYSYYIISALALVGFMMIKKSGKNDFVNRTVD